MSSTIDIASSFIQGASPGELKDVVKDIKALTSDDDPALISKLKPAFEKYNEEQLTVTKLPGSSQPVYSNSTPRAFRSLTPLSQVLISSHNRLSPNTYLDTSSSTSFNFDHTTQTPSNPQPHKLDSPHSSLVQSLLSALSTHFAEHYLSTPSSAYTVCPSSSSPNAIAILLSTTKSSPTNFLSGRWRSVFLYNPSSQSLTGTVHINVHYYEDGNVALTTTKKISVDGVSADGEGVVRRIGQLEKQYQEEVNRAFVGMNEGSFKALRRQLPVTRQRVEWEKIRGYGLGSDLRGEVRR